MFPPRRIWQILTLVLLALTGSCSSRDDQTSLSIAAAASLTNPLTEIGEAFTSETGIAVTLTFASTGHLSQQIQNGAPYDVFAAADAFHIDGLIVQGLLDAQSRTAFAEGTLVLIIEPEYEEPLDIPSDLIQPDITRIVIANPEHAPYGLAAKQFFIATNLWESIQDRLVFSENVRQAAQIVHAGNATIGIVAASTTSSEAFRIIPIDQAYYQPILHVAAIVNSSKKVNEARRFLNFIHSETSIEIFSSYGLQALKAD